MQKKKQRRSLAKSSRCLQHDVALEFDSFCKWPSNVPRKGSFPENKFVTGLKHPRGLNTPHHR